MIGVFYNRTLSTSLPLCVKGVLEGSTIGVLFLFSGIETRDRGPVSPESLFSVSGVLTSRDQ